MEKMKARLKTLEKDMESVRLMMGWLIEIQAGMQMNCEEKADWITEKVVRVRGQKGRAEGGAGADEEAVAPAEATSPAGSTAEG